MGNELFLTIGNFDLNNRDKFKRKSIFSFGKREAYYYVDDVLLCEIGIDSTLYFLSLNTTLDSQLFDIDEIDISAKDIIKTPNREDTLVQLIPDEGGSKTFFIYFEPNSYKLNDTIYRFFSYVVEVLRENPSLKILIKGYQETNESDDIKLAEKEQ